MIICKNCGKEIKRNSIYESKWCHVRPNGGYFYCGEIIGKFFAEPHYRKLKLKRILCI